MSYVVRIIDRVLEVLMRPRVRRVLRWSFVMTLPLFAYLVSVRGVDTVLALVVLELAAFVAVLALAAKLGGERGQVILDMLMHPTVRRILRSEATIVLTLALVPSRLVRRPAPGAFGYGRGNSELPLALALLPAVAAEAAAVHLLLPDSLSAVKIAVLAVSAYGLVWILGWAAGIRLHPHRIRDGVLHARLGALYRADVPLDAIAGLRVTRARRGDRTVLTLDGDRAAFSVGGRTDVHLDLDREVLVQRPFGEAVAVRRLSIAAEDPKALAHALAHGERAPDRDRNRGCSAPPSDGPAGAEQIPFQIS